MGPQELLNKYKVALLFACRKDRDEQFIERCTVDLAELDYAIKQAEKLSKFDMAMTCKEFFHD